MLVPPDLARAPRSAALRLTMLRSIRIGARASVAVLAAAVIASVASAVVPLAVPSLWVIAASIGVGLFATGLAAVLRPVSVRAASQLLDRRLHLQERTSTALELALGVSPPSTLGARVIADAVDHLRAIQLRSAFPLRPPREAWWMMILAILLVTWSVWFRGLAIPGTPAHRIAQVIREEGGRLEQVAQSQQARARAERIPQTRKLADQMRNLGVRLQRDRVDRAEALARVGELSRQTERVRREIDDRLDEIPPHSRRDASVPLSLLRRQALERQIKQLQELSSRLRQDQTAADRRSTLERLAAMAESSAEDRAAPVQRQLEQARDQLARGNVGNAGESLTEALRTLEGMQSLVADDEGLQTAQRQLQRAGANIASGTSEAIPRDSAEEPSPSARPPTGPGPNPIPNESSPDASQPPQGPYEGLTAGTGAVPEKLGDPTARLQAEKSTTRVRGARGEGEVSVSEILGASRPGTSRAPLAPVPSTIIPQADRYMERMGIPARYRQLVRQYFERLARLR